MRNPFLDSHISAEDNPKFRGSGNPEVNEPRRSNHRAEALRRGRRRTIGVNPRDSASRFLLPRVLRLHASWNSSFSGRRGADGRATFSRLRIKFTARRSSLQRCLVPQVMQVQPTAGVIDTTPRCSSRALSSHFLLPPRTALPCYRLCEPGMKATARRKKRGSKTPKAA